MKRMLVILSAAFVMGQAADPYAGRPQRPANGRCWSTSEATTWAQGMEAQYALTGLFGSLGGLAPSCPTYPQSAPVYRAPLCSNEHFNDFAWRYVANEVRRAGNEPRACRQAAPRPTVGQPPVASPRPTPPATPPAALAKPGKFSFAQVNECFQVASAMSALFHDRPIKQAQWKPQVSRLNDLLYETAIAEGLGIAAYIDAMTGSGRTTTHGYIANPDLMRGPMFRCDKIGLINIPSG